MPDAENHSSVLTPGLAHDAVLPPTGVVVPAWVLPMLRLIRENGGDLAAAWAALPSALPAGTMPDEQDAAILLIELGMA